MSDAGSRPGGLALVSGNSDLNIRNGTLPWTMTYSAGRSVADVVLGKRPDIDFDEVGDAVWVTGRRLHVDDAFVPSVVN